MSYTHIVFDIDGTLLNSEYSCLKSLQDTLLEETGRLCPLDDLVFSLGITGADALRQLGIGDVPRVWERWAEHTVKYRPTLAAYPGIPQLVEELERRGLRLGVVTSRTRREFEEEALPALPFLRRFGVIVLADHTGAHKPHPAPLLNYMERAGAAPAQVLYLGDTGADAGCARGAGVDFALARWGSREEVPAKYILNKPEELLNCL